MSVITVADLTEATLDGGGIFDVLMRANKAHLEAEFTKGRIRGPEYATVYLGSLEAIMTGAMQFLLQKQKAGLDADLVAQQIELAKAQEDLVKQQTLNALAEEAVLKAQKCKLDAEYDVLMLTKAKVTAETALLTQKSATEQAQTNGEGVAENSVIGKQILLYNSQANGFTRDAEQKAAKLLVDSWSVRRTTDEGVVADATNMLHDPTIGRAINKLLQGVGA